MRKYTAILLMAIVAAFCSCTRQIVPTDRNVYVVDAQTVDVREGEDTPLYLNFRDGGLDVDNGGWGDAWDWAFFHGEVRDSNGQRYGEAVFIGQEGVLTDGQKIFLKGARRYDMVIGGLTRGTYTAMFNITTRYGVDTYASVEFSVLPNGGVDPDDPRILVQTFSIPTEEKGAELDEQGRLILFMEDYNSVSPFIYHSRVTPEEAENAELRAVSDDEKVVIAGMRPGNVLTLVPQCPGTATVTIQTVDRTVIRTFKVNVMRRGEEKTFVDDFSMPNDETDAELDASGAFKIDINTYDETSPFKYNCKIYPADASNAELKALSSNDSVASAAIENSTCLVVTPHSVGRAVITVSTIDGTVVKNMNVLIFARVVLTIDTEEGEPDETQKKRAVFPCNLTFQSASRVKPAPLFIELYAKVTGRVDLTNPDDHFVVDSLKNAKTAYYSMKKNTVMVLKADGSTKYRIYDYLMKPVTDTQVKVWHDDDTPGTGYRVENFVMYSVSIEVRPEADYDPDLYEVVINEAFRRPSKKIYRFLI